MPETRGQAARRILRYTIRIIVPADIVLFLLSGALFFAVERGFALFLILGFQIVVVLPFSLLLFLLLYVTRGSYDPIVVGGSVFGWTPGIELLLRRDHRTSTGSDVSAGFKRALKYFLICVCAVTIFPLISLLSGGDWRTALRLEGAFGIALLVLALIMTVYVLASALINRLLGDEPDVAG